MKFKFIRETAVGFTKGKIYEVDPVYETILDDTGRNRGVVAYHLLNSPDGVWREMFTPCDFKTYYEQL
jgi:hypothetical protein